MVTGAISTPYIAVETSSRPDGSSRKATGAAAASQAASQHGARGSPSPRRARGPRGRARPCRGPGERSESLRRRRSRSLVSRSSSEASTPREHREELLVLGAEARPCSRDSAASEPTREPSESSSGDAEVGAGAEARLGGDAAVDRVARRRRCSSRGARSSAMCTQKESVSGRARFERRPNSPPLRRVDDAVDVVAAVEVGEEDRRRRAAAASSRSSTQRVASANERYASPRRSPPPGWLRTPSPLIIGHGPALRVTPASIPRHAPRDLRRPRRRRAARRGGPRRRGRRLRGRARVLDRLAGGDAAPADGPTLRARRRDAARARAAPAGDLRHRPQLRRARRARRARACPRRRSSS